MIYIEEKNAYLMAFFVMLIVICAFIVVANVQFMNGKISLCNELNNTYNPEKGCIDCDFDEHYEDGRCVRNYNGNLLQFD